MRLFQRAISALWRRPAPEDGPGMYRYSETPGMTREERQQAEPWNYPEQEAECFRAITRGNSRDEGRERGRGLSR